MTIVVILLFFVFLFIGIPISLVLAITSLTYLLFGDLTTLMSSAPQKMFSGIDNFGLLAVPLFMLAGELMNGGGITKRLVAFAKVLIGHYQGGLAYVTVIANMFLASILGSANAQAAMMSKVMVPEMEKEGYTREFSSAITLASSIVAPIIPPSMLFIIYGTLTGASIADLFMAGIIPGIMLGIGFIIVIGMMNRKQQFPKSEKASIGMIFKTFVQVIPAMLIPFTIILWYFRWRVYAYRIRIDCMYHCIYYRDWLPRIKNESIAYDFSKHSREYGYNFVFNRYGKFVWVYHRL